jgi:hypothetical protein
MGNGTVSQLEKAIQLNRYYAHCLRRTDGCVGWLEQFGQFGQVLNLRRRDVTEQRFAQSIYSWQQSQPGLIKDGILGINTWSRLNNLYPTNRGFNIEVPSGMRSPLTATPNGALSPAITGSPTVSPARGFLFVVFDQLPEVGTRNLVRKVGVVPKNFALYPANPLGRLTAAQHALGFNPRQSQWLSASSRPFGAANFRGTPLLMDTAKIAKGGGRIITTAELVAALHMHAGQNPSSASQVNRLINAITHVEGEVLVEGSTPPRSALPLSASHNRYVKAAEALWEQFDAKQMTRSELETGLSSLDDAYKSARAVGRVGRVFMVAGIVFTAVDITRATSQSIDQRSGKPIAAETVRQVGGWGSAIAGAKIGALTGAAFGIETGPGAVITGAIGAVIFGAAGYFGADWIADHISEN